MSSIFIQETTYSLYDVSVFSEDIALAYGSKRAELWQAVELVPEVKAPRAALGGEHLNGEEQEQ